ncbi:MAG: hypothetical protein IJU84_06675 [Clostridia bacterium]|nr:hypothetical protein [Clostridia bacterium]
MMKKLTTMFLVCVLSLALFIPAGCVKYHAKIWYPSIYEWKIRSDLPEVHTQDSYYLNPDYDPDYIPEYNEEGELIGPENEEYLFCGLEYPREVIVVIDSQEKLEARYEKYPEFDFNKQMFIVYYFTTVNNNRIRAIKEVELKNGELTIYWTERKPWPNNKKDAHMPVTTAFTVLMDKVEFETVKFQRVR